MPSNFCLLPKYREELAQRVARGDLSLSALAGMTSAERRAAFDFMGETNAQYVNAAFESKLLLKHQQQGLETWIRQTTQGKPAIQRDLLSRVQRMDRVLESSDPFLEDLARQRLGFGVTMEEAGRITELAKAASDARAALENGGDRMVYGRAKVAFSNYVSDLKNGVKEPLTAGKAVRNTASFAKAFTAAFDNSALFRQGWKNLWSHPEVWAKNARQSFTDLVQQFGGKEVLDEVHAEILSRPNALNGRYQKARLALNNIEEQFPTSLGEKITSKVPILGRAYKASEAAYTAFQQRTRADLFDKYAEIAERSGVDLDDRRQIESIGKLVNSLTSRGDLGRLEGSADVVNEVFFSARKLKSDLDFLTAHQLQGDVTPFVRQQAAKNLAQTIAGTATVLYLANATARAMGHKDVVEWDPRSSDFGKIKVGNTRFDVTGGMGSILTLGARLATMESKSSTTGRVSEINSGDFGAQTGTDLVYNFFENKLSPAASIVRDVLKGETRDGERPGVLNQATKIVVPLSAANAWELYKDPQSAGLLAGGLADFFGIATTNYDGRLKRP